MTKNVMITGGLGLIGSRLVKMFEDSSEEWDTHVIDIQRFYLPFHDRSNRDMLRLQHRFDYVDGATLHSLDTRNSFEMGDLIRSIQPDLFIHLAALPLANISNIISEEASGTVIDATLSIIENIRRFSPKTKIIYASSSMVYGHFLSPIIDETHITNPMSIYGAVKLAGEVLVRGFCEKNDIDYSIIRPSAVYGPTDVNRRVVQAFLDDSLDRKPLQVKGADSMLDFTYVDDIAQGFYLAGISNASSGEVFNITSSDPHSIGDLAKIFQIRFPHINIEIEEHEAGVPKRGGLDTSKARKTIGFEPKFDFIAGVNNYIDRELEING
jgi:nucleoside-diphosphate-sugar epimerase